MRPKLSTFGPPVGAADEKKVELAAPAFVRQRGEVAKIG
jgi:hypothetical protein